MGRASGMIVRWAIATSVFAILLSPAAFADVTTERGSSIIIFPKVISDADGFQTRGFPVETMIQISNLSNSLAFAHCFYVDSSPEDPTQPPGVFNPPRWQEVDFDIMLTGRIRPRPYPAGTSKFCGVPRVCRSRFFRGVSERQPLEG